MTKLSPEAVAQMVADMADGLDMAAEAEVLVFDGLEKYVTLFQADDRDPKTMRALRVYNEAKSNHRRFVNEAAALRTLAADNATLQHDYDMATVTAAKFMADAVQRLETAEFANATLRASEAAALERITELEAATQLALDTADMSNNTRAALLDALNSSTAITPTSGKGKGK